MYFLLTGLWYLVFLLNVYDGVLAAPLHQESTDKPSENQVNAGSVYPDTMDPIRAGADITEASEILSLRQALSLALMHNPSLEAFSWEVRAAEAMSLQSRLYPNPELNVEAENVTGTGPYKDFDQSETTIQIGQLIELGGKRLKRLELAQHEKDLAQWDYETARQDLILQVALRYLDVLATQERIGLYKDMERLSSEVFYSISERVKAGQVSPLEESRAKVEFTSVQIQREKEELYCEAARSLLAATWGKSFALFKNVSGNLEQLISIPSLGVLIEKIKQNPDLIRWNSEIAQRKAVLALEASKRIPDLTVNGGVRYIKENNDTTLVIGFSMPLLLFNRNQGAIQAAGDRIQKTIKEQEAAEIEITSKLHSIYQSLAAINMEIRRLRDDILPSAQHSYQAFYEGYNRGKFSYLTVLDAQRSLFESKIRHLEVLVEHHKLVANLERLIGGSVEEFSSSNRNDRKDNTDEK